MISSTISTVNPNVSDSQFGEQLRLFDPGPKREAHPGDLPYEEWSARPDVVHHSTFSKDWSPRDKEFDHYGSLEAAEQNASRNWRSLDTVAQGGEPGGSVAGITLGDDSWSETYQQDVAEATGPGVIHSRRITASGIANEPHAKRYGTGIRDMRMTDAAANLAGSGAAHATNVSYLDIDEYGESGEASQYERDTGVSVASIIDYAEGHTEELEGGREAKSVQQGMDNLMHTAQPVPIAYENEVEDKGSTSYVAPHHAVTSWEEDVMSSPNVSQEMKDLVQARADKVGPRTTPFAGRAEKSGAEVTAGGSLSLSSIPQSPVTWGRREYVQPSLPFPDKKGRTRIKDKTVRSYPAQVENPIHKMLEVQRQQAEKTSGFSIKMGDSDG